ncbi:MAG: hypothetical protein ACXAB7_03275 [Candidatus Kariarchaeaceae archaeon]
MIIFGVLLYLLFPDTRSYIIPIIIVLYLPIFGFSAFRYRLHYRGVPSNQRITHQLRMYNMLKDNNYYNLALENWKLHSTNLTEHQRVMILNELVDSVLLNEKPNPPNLFAHWGSEIQMEEGVFVEHLIEHTEIMDGMSLFGGTGLLPDVWPLLSSDEIKERILETVLEGCNNLEHASHQEKKLFLEDLYLVELQLREFIGKNPDWQTILDEIDEFEPDIPPRNIFQQAQMQAAEQNKMLAETKNPSSE